MLNLTLKLAAFVKASRPLTWLFSITSAICGMVMAFRGIPPIHLILLVSVGVGPCITAAINLLNAVFDIEVDKLSKPDRPLPKGQISVFSTLAVSSLLYLIGLIIAFSLGFWPFILALIGVLLSILYSVPPVRIKAVGGLSNFSLALGYTMVCFVGGWVIFRSPLEAPWFIIFLATLQVVGANVVKDFVDYEADKEMKIETLPVKFGIKKSIALISPLFIGIYLVIPLFYLLGYLKSAFLPVSLFSIWGIYIIHSLIHDFSRKNREKIFIHAFFMSLSTEIAFSIAYLLA